ncbi:MAG TPA: hypothetical protein ENN40_10170 [Candidatus Aminicenantes bacterium]|nr:hypothetical protein [Candidatus Aminicenantes bacterium]
MNVLLAVTGSISAYKAVDILRAFQRLGHDVSVVLTRNACRFVKPLTFDTFVPGRVHTQWFEDADDPLEHINLGRKHDLLLIAPASAATIARMAAGMANDLLSATYLAFPGRVVIAPAMNEGMYAHPAVKHNLTILKERGVEVIPPDSGELACGGKGAGRLPEPQHIVEHCLGVMRV